MKISSIPQLYRNLRRWQEILAVLQRYGLADWLSQFPQLPFREYLKDRDGQPLANQSREVRIRKALCELGPTFIKLGQTLAARSDLVGVALAEEFKRLHANVPPDPPETVTKLLRQELGDLVDTEFVDLDPVPLAAASIGQVHTATLRDGTEVVLKIQRERIEATIHQDLDVLAGLAQLAQRVPAIAAWGPVEMVRQLSPMLRRELDFQRERQNLMLFAEFFADDDTVEIPTPINHLCTHRVLTMTRFRGESLGDCIRRVQTSEQTVTPSDNGKENRKSLPMDHSPQQLGISIANAYMKMIFEFGLFHADPHAGNLMLLGSGRLGILDFGMVGRIDDRLRESIEEMMVAISSGDQRSLTRLLKRVGSAPPSIDDAAFSIDVAEYIGTYGRQTMQDFDLTEALNDLSMILHRHGIKLPHQSALLLKMLVSLEGTLAGLQADIDTLGVIGSFVRRAMWRRMNPKRRFQQARRIYLEAENFLEVAPDQLISLLDQARTGKITLQLEHRRIGPTVNRLVLGLISSALFLGSALLLAQEVPPLLFPDSTFLGFSKISIFGLAGCGLSLFEMVRLMRAIRKSGALTRDPPDEP
jgi:ubiquinone biosynthesis protein